MMKDIDKTEVLDNYGEFSSLEELLNAYKSLKEELDKTGKIINQFDNETDNIRAQETEKDKNSLIEQVLNDEQAIELLVLNNDIRERVISDYLKSLLSLPEVKTLGNDCGYSPLSPVIKPKNLKEAKALAGKLLKQP